MAGGFLSPDARLRVFSDLGLVVPGAKLFTYVSGTPATPLGTTSDAAGLVPNTNPIVASAGGLFGPIYLTPGLAYKYVLTDALGGPIWSQDPVSLNLLGLATAGTVDTGINNFRLTLESGVPLSTTDQLAKTILYCTPNGKGTRIALGDATGVATVLSSAEFSVAVPATTATLYSVFAWNNAGVPTLELAAWTNDTTPGPAAFSLSSVTGTRTKTGDLTRRYLGLLRTGTVAGQTEISATKVYVVNTDNRIRRFFLRLESTASWSYNVATIRQVNANVLNQIDFLIALPEIAIDAVAQLVGFSASVGTSVITGIGLDSTTVFHGAPGGGAEGGVNQPFQATGRYAGFPGIGKHFASWNEVVSVAAGAATLEASALANNTSGLSAWVEI